MTKSSFAAFAVIALLSASQAHAVGSSRPKTPTTPSTPTHPGTLNGPQTAANVRAAVAADRALDARRKRIIDTAFHELDYGLCGNAARNRYGASGKWCTEFARHVLRNGGLRDIRYCYVGVLGACFYYKNLSDVTDVPQITSLFNANGGYVPRASITPATANPGDYLAITHDGASKDHSGIIVGISADRSMLYTIEGNVNDCVLFLNRAYFVNGKLNPDIIGIGRSAVAF